MTFALMRWVDADQGPGTNVVRSVPGHLLEYGRGFWGERVRNGVLEYRTKPFLVGMYPGR